jgi:ankyrin repeat protein
MEWLTVADKRALSASCRAWWTHVPPRYKARQARLVIEESILWPAIIDAPGREGATRLFWASINGKLSRVEALIKWGADVNKASSDGVTPLMAASYDDAEVARALLAAGADVNAADDDGWTVLMFASCDGRVEIVRDLLAAGANKHAVNNDGETAYTLAGLMDNAASAPAIRALLAAEP